VSALEYAERCGHEEVLLVRESASGLRAVIALHDSILYAPDYVVNAGGLLSVLFETVEEKLAAARAARGRLR